MIDIDAFSLHKSWSNIAILVLYKDFAICSRLIVDDCLIGMTIKYLVGPYTFCKAFDLAFCVFVVYYWIFWKYHYLNKSATRDF